MNNILYLLIFCTGHVQSSDDLPESKFDEGMKAYVIGFSMKRKEQFKSVEQWARNANNYELIRLAFDAILKVIHTQTQVGNKLYLGAGKFKRNFGIQGHTKLHYR